MPNPENLIGHEFTSNQNRDEAAKNGRKGGKASGEARRKRKAMREAFDILLSRQYGSNGSDGVEVLAAKVFQRALDGDMKAVQFIRDTVGEMPVQRVEVDTIDPKARERVERILSED